MKKNTNKQQKKNDDLFKAAMKDIAKDPVLAEAARKNPKLVEKMVKDTIAKAAKQPAVVFANEADAVTVRITGQAFKNLKELAKIFGKWRGEPCTPAELLGIHLNCDPGFNNIDEKKPMNGEQTIAGCLVELQEDDEPEKEVRKLEAAFKKAGFAIN